MVSSSAPTADTPGLPTNLTTLAELLQEEGYSTHAVGGSPSHMDAPQPYQPSPREMAPGVLQEGIPADAQGLRSPLRLLARGAGATISAIIYSCQDYYEHTRTTGNDVGYDFRLVLTFLTTTGRM